MSTLGEIVTILTADHTQFKKNMEDSAARLEAFGGSAMSAGTALSAGLTAPIVAVVGGIALAINAAADMADEMTKLSQTSGLSTTALQEFKYVGEQTSVSLQTIANGSAILTRNLLSGAAGSEDMQVAMQFLGLSVKDTSGHLKTQEQLFDETITALAGIKDGAEQSALAQKLFGKAGKELLPLLAEGSDGLAAMRSRAHELGVVMGEDAIKDLDTFGDQLSSVKSALQGAGNQIAAGFLPVLKTLVSVAETSVIPAIIKVAGYLGELSKWFAGLPAPIQVTVFAVAGLAAAIGPLVLVLGGIASAAPGVIAGFLAIKVAMATTAAFASGSLIPAIVAIGAPLLALAAVVAAGVIVWKVWGDDIKAIVTPFTDWMYGKLYQLGKWIGTSFPALFGQGAKGVKSAGLVIEESVKVTATGVNGQFKGMTDTNKTYLDVMSKDTKDFYKEQARLRKEAQEEEEKQQAVLRKLREERSYGFRQLTLEVAKMNLEMAKTRLPMLDTSVLVETETKKMGTQFDYLSDGMAKSFKEGFNSIQLGWEDLQGSIKEGGRALAQRLKGIFDPVQGLFTFISGMGVGKDNGITNSVRLKAPIESLMQKSTLDTGFERETFGGFSKQIGEGLIGFDRANSMLSSAQKVWDVLSDVFKGGAFSKDQQEQIGQAAFTDIFKNQDTNLADILNRAFEAIAPSGVAAGGDGLAGIDLSIEIHGNVGVDDIAEEIVRSLRDKGIIP